MSALIGIVRHKIATDGQGVTTLVAFHGCPLHCRYCLNPQCLRPDGVVYDLTPEEVLEQVMTDNLYFLATGGGVTFGGGEPALHSHFISRFCQLAPKEWTINMETSFHVARHHLETLLPFIDHYIIDIKDMDPVVYRSYTGRDNSLVKDNLRWLALQGKADTVTVRLPLIPGYNSDAHRAKSKEELSALGFTHFDEFEYVQPDKLHD